MSDKLFDIRGHETREIYSRKVPLWSLTNFNRPHAKYLLIVLRVLQACLLTQRMIHADEYWQGTEAAYDVVYGGVQLPWEWNTRFRLRNTIYPYYLAAPLFVLKQLGLDYNLAVRCCPYLAHCILVCIGDHYLWKVGIKTVGLPSTRIAFVLYLASANANMLMIRCFTNSVETIFLIVAFYYFLHVKKRFDRNIVIMTALISLSFMIRNTAPIGWIPLLLVKIICEGSFNIFLRAGVFVALPVIGFGIFLDSIYYGSDQITMTFLNFLTVNVIENRSASFGTEPPLSYVTQYLPGYFHLAYPVLIFALYFYYQGMRK